MMRKRTMKYKLAITATLLCSAALYSAHAQDITSNPFIKIDQSVVELGDIFSGVSNKDAERDIIKAPAPGKSMQLSADWLKKTAKHFGYTWQMNPTSQTVIVERQTSYLNAPEFSEAILNAIQQDLAGNYEIELDNKDIRVAMAAELPKTVEIKQLAVDRLNNRFSATAITPYDQGKTKSRKITGRLYKLVDVPVLTTRKMNGEVIRKDDVDFVRLRERDLTSHALLSPEKIIGMTPKRVVDSSTPVRGADLQPPLLVKKNETVNVKLEVNNMSLVMRGRALEDGSRGDFIRILNPVSKRIVEGQVVDAGTVKLDALSNGPVNLAVN